MNITKMPLDCRHECASETLQLLSVCLWVSLCVKTALRKVFLPSERVAGSTLLLKWRSCICSPAGHFGTVRQPSCLDSCLLFLLCLKHRLASFFPSSDKRCKEMLWWEPWMICRHLWFECTCTNTVSQIKAGSRGKLLPTGLNEQLSITVKLWAASPRLISYLFSKNGSCFVLYCIEFCLIIHWRIKAHVFEGLAVVSVSHFQAAKQWRQFATGTDISAERQKERSEVKAWMLTENVLLRQL